MGTPILITKRDWSTAEVNDLEDAAFLYIEQGGEKDAGGKTSPRELRHFPVYDADGLLDLPHLRNALSRIPQASADWLSANEKDRLLARARKLLDDAQKTTHKRAVGLPDWALKYVAHADDHEALGIGADQIGKGWTGDPMIGKRAAEILRSRVVAQKDRTTKRITKAIDKLLRVKVAVHNAGEPKFRARIGTVKLAYQRGVSAYAKTARPCLKSAPQWGFTRVAALLSYCKSGTLPHAAYTADLDLFPMAKLRKDGEAPVGGGDMTTGDLAAGGVLAPEQGLSGDKGKVRHFAGLPIVVDRPKGFEQIKTDAKGREVWRRTYKVDYGYIPSTLGGDQEELDVFLGPDEQAPTAHWIVQTDKNGDFDEYKVILGAEDQDAARAIYLDHVPEQYLGRMFETPVAVLHALLGLEPEDLLKAVEPGYHFVATKDGDLATAHPWTTLGMGADAGDGEDDKPTKLPSAPLALSASAHAALASAAGAVKALLPVDGAATFVTPLAAGGGAPAPDKVALFSAPDPYVADLEAILAAAEEAERALVEMPETSKNVAMLAKLGGVFKMDATPGRVWVATYPLPVTAADVDPIEDREMAWKAVDQERIDEVYAKYHDTVNMSASELEAWSKTECSKLASLDRRPIARNLALLRTAKDQWGAAEVAQANRTISFVSRMKGAEQGEPAKEGCPSKRDISLKNWAYDPGKKVSAAGPTGEEIDLMLAAEPAEEVEELSALPDEIEKTNRDDHGRFAGGSGGGGATHVSQVGGGSFAHPSNTAHQSMVHWGHVKAQELGKPIHAHFDAKLDNPHSGGLRLATKPPKKGPYSTIHPDGSITHTHPEPKPAKKKSLDEPVGKAGTLLQIGKADGTEERYTLGIVLVPDEADLQGDTYDKATVRRAADIFMSDYQNTGLQHNVKPGDIAAFRDEHPELYNGKILIVDSFVIPDEMGDVVINGQTIKAGTWLMGHRWVDDALWADVKAKKYTGLSMGGFARRIALGQQTAASPASPALPS